MNQILEVILVSILANIPVVMLSNKLYQDHLKNMEDIYQKHKVAIQILFGVELSPEPIHKRLK